MSFGTCTTLIGAKRSRVACAGVSGVTEYPQPLVLVADIDVTAPVHKHIFSLRDERSFGHGPVSAAGLGRHEKANLSRQTLVRNIVHAQPGIEVCDVEQIALFLHGWIVL